MKKVCVLAFIPCLLCTAALATELPPRQEYIYGDDTYTLTEDGTAKITGYSGTEPEVVIPSKVDGHPVTLLADFTERQRAVLLAGGLLNYTKESENK